MHRSLLVSGGNRAPVLVDGFSDGRGEAAAMLAMIVKRQRADRIRT
jgi:hypothetical protein